jgi:hypothetical protein
MADITEFSNQIPFFLETFLSKPASALPKGAQWILKFDGAYAPGGKGNYGGLIPVQAIKKGILYEPGSWSIDEAITIAMGDDYQKTKGCMFVQAVEIPGESTTVNPDGLQQNGFIRTTIGAGRDAYNGIRVVFLETNVSFVDNVIRPWVIATSHLGLIARERPDENYRCNMTVYKLGVTSRDRPPNILQKYTFFGICPISVAGEEYNYGQTNSPILRDTSFIYHYYTLESVRSFDNSIKPVPLSTNIDGKNVSVARATAVTTG